VGVVGWSTIGCGIAAGIGLATGGGDAGTNDIFWGAGIGAGETGVAITLTTGGLTGAGAEVGIGGGAVGFVAEVFIVPFFAAAFISGGITMVLRHLAHLISLTILSVAGFTRIFAPQLSHTRMLSMIFPAYSRAYRQLQTSSGF